MYRKVLAAVIGLLLNGLTVWAADEPPIPQNPERQEREYRDTIEWNRRTLQGAYEKVGKKDRRWDEPAIAALGAAARFFSNAVDPHTSEEEIYAAAQRALDAGCDDPLVRYLWARSSHAPNHPGPAEYIRRMIEAGEALETSAYSPFRRAIAVSKAGQIKAQTNLTPDGRRSAERLLDSAVALVVESTEKDEPGVNVEKKWFEVATQAVQAHHFLSKDYKAAFQRVDAILARAPALEVLRLQLKGHYLIEYAWEARGKGYANTVTEEGWRLFTERLTEAQTNLERAWDVKPGDRQTTDLMLIVVKGLDPERESMELWFRRAMEADGNNGKACLLKMDWLDPKWHGTPQELLAFGRACRDTKNWRAGLILRLADAHMRLAVKMEQDERDKYLASAEVWDDIRSVHEEFLKHYTADYPARNYYAALCCMCGRFTEANEQFKIIGERFAANPYFTADRMKLLRDFAAAKAKEQTK